ncbi:MAG: hypothetical protein LBH32_02845 [Dysgonamonadaceae bacterium]|jgi:hypothetical protein|nr:hypothetical protein [Dysgonamonadaceae bacterium]
MNNQKTVRFWVASTLAALMLTFPAMQCFAADVWGTDRSQNRFGNRSSAASQSGLRSGESGNNGGIIPGGDGTRPGSEEALDAPVGDANYWIIALGLAYGVYVFGRKRNATDAKE